VAVQTPVDLTFRNVPSTADVQRFVERHARRLERFCDGLVRCRVAVERPQRHQRSGNPYRVRIEVTLPPRKDLVVVEDPEDNEMHVGLQAVVRRAFHKMERQLKDVAELRRGAVKTHPEPRGIVVRLLDGYGFIKSLDGREIYFHRNSVLHGAFDELRVGGEVRFEHTEGEQGPQATSVQIVNPIGARVAEGADSERLPPGWK
jgi:cold shock CspA family protein